MRKVALTALLIIQCTMCTMAQVGTWRAYMSYAEPQQIVKAGNLLFVQASNSLYQYNLNDKSITTYDKTTGLNDTYITHIAWNQQAKRLIIVYQNSNIDLINTGNEVINISALYNKSTTEDKTINNIYTNDRHAYLCTNFGIVKVDMQRAEISETYNLKKQIEAAAINGSNIFARTTSGMVLTASMNTNLQNPANWQPTTDFSSTMFDSDLTDWNEYIDIVRTLKPDGPKYNNFGYIKFVNNKLYTCNGDYDNGTPIQVYKENEWDIYQYEDISQHTGVSFQGSFCIDIDPTSDSDHVFAGSRNGLYEYVDGKFVNYYDYNNSPIERYNGRSVNYQLVTGTKFDHKGNLWILNSEAPTASLIKLSNGEFTKYNKPELMKLNDGGFTNKSNNELSKMIIDSYGIMWFVNNNWRLPALYQYNIDNDIIIAYESFVNQDNAVITETSGVKCVVEDKQHNIWIGLSKGPLMLERNEINNNSSVFTQIKVPRNDGTNYADYLLSGVDITSIAIDGGNRKWFGTNGNGAYLISADNMEQIYHFTTENSQLLSNEILSIAINDITGEVFFGTEKGLCSYISDATMPNENMTKDNVYAYPNPVTPDYHGLVTITGLSYNTDVKIVTTSGALVAKGRSNGGAFIWDCTDLCGRRVASGIYMVETATASGGKGTICKIAVLN